MRCLAKDRGLRPASAKVLIEELELAETAVAWPNDATLDPSASDPARTPTPAEPSEPRYTSGPARPREPLPASSPQWRAWASSTIGVVILVIGGWYFERGRSGTSTRHQQTMPAHGDATLTDGTGTTYKTGYLHFQLQRKTNPFENSSPSGCGLGKLLSWQCDPKVIVLHCLHTSGRSERSERRDCTQLSLTGDFIMR